MLCLLGMGLFAVSGYGADYTISNGNTQTLTGLGASTTGFGSLEVQSGGTLQLTNGNTGNATDTITISGTGNGTVVGTTPYGAIYSPVLTGNMTQSQGIWANVVIDGSAAVTNYLENGDQARLRFQGSVTGGDLTTYATQSSGMNVAEIHAGMTSTFNISSLTVAQGNFTFCGVAGNSSVETHEHYFANGIIVNQGAILRSWSEKRLYLYTSTDKTSLTTITLRGAYRSENSANTLFANFVLDGTSSSFSGGTRLDIGSSDATEPETLISGTGVLNTNVSTLALHDANTYSGGTNVGGNATLLISNAQATGTGTVTLNATGALSLNGIAEGMAFALGGLAGGGTTNISSESANDATLKVGSANATQTYSGTLADSTTGKVLSVEKVGTGTWTLTGSSTYTGNTTISGGTLKLTGDAALAADSAITVASGATLEINNTKTYGNAISMEGAGANSVGALNFTDSGQVSGNVVLTGNSTLAVSAGKTAILSSGLGGTSTLTKTGTGTLDLRGAVENNQQIQLNAGTIRLSSETSNVAGVATRAKTATRIIFDGYTVNTGTWAIRVGSITEIGAGGLKQNGGTYYIAQTTFTVSEGVTQATAQYWNSASAVGSQITLNIGSGQTLNFQTAIKDHLSDVGALIATSSITKTGAGTAVLNQAQTYTGLTTISGGTLKLTGDAALAANSAITVASGATLEINNTATYGTVSLAGTGASGVGALNFTASGIVQTAALTADALVSVATHQSGAVNTISGDHTLTKTGDGALYLNGSLNSLAITEGSFSPGTAINTVGKLTLGADNHLLTSGNGLLIIDVMNSNGTLSYDVLNFTQENTNVDFMDESLFLNFVNFEPNNSTVYPLNFLENVLLAAGDYTSWLHSPQEGWQLLADGNGGLVYRNAMAVPEPSTWMLLALGLGLLWRKRCR
ncbi:MAG: autotransporter-associated beta strand repeat-containing protein [Planctomycetia bacterium]|nr:autotransporter-associated beta strand repeat-containing protein [Planctomycetia bacterium]